LAHVKISLQEHTLFAEVSPLGQLTSHGRRLVGGMEKAAGDDKKSGSERLRVALRHASSKHTLADINCLTHTGDLVPLRVNIHK